MSAVGVHMEGSLITGVGVADGAVAVALGADNQLDSKPGIGVSKGGIPRLESVPHKRHPEILALGRGVLG